MIGGVAVLLDDVHVVRRGVEFGVFVLGRIDGGFSTIKRQLISQFDPPIPALDHGLDLSGLDHDAVIGPDLVHGAFDAVHLNTSAAVVDQGDSKAQLLTVKRSPG